VPFLAVGPITSRDKIDSIGEVGVLLVAPAIANMAFPLITAST